MSRYRKLSARLRRFRKWALAPALILAPVILNGGGCGEATSTSAPATSASLITLDPARESTHLSRAGDASDAFWVRGLDFRWGSIERTPGEFDWSAVDTRVREESREGICFLAMVQPFASWDQDACHQDPRYVAQLPSEDGTETVKVGKPCDMEAYAHFLRRLVERYDGDGRDDMPGLEVPIKYWEIMNEPSMQGGRIGGVGEELKFFVGTPEEYLQILETSYDTIKGADPEARVAHAGIAGMQGEFLEFWTPIFEKGGGAYFDIANIHSISTGSDRVDLFTLAFRNFLEKYDLGDKPIWITEVQIGSLTEKPESPAAFERLLVESTVSSLAHGAEKLF